MRAERGARMREIGTVFPAVFRGYLGGGDPRVVEILAPLWTRVAGKAIAANSKPVAFAAGTLTVAAPAGPWVAQLEMMAEEIRAAINAYLGRRIVKKVRIRLQTAARLSGQPPFFEN